VEPSERLNSVKEFRAYKRNLPHFEHPGSIYFITFRTVSGFTLPDSAKDIVFSSLKFHAEKKHRLHACVIMNDHVHCILHPMEKLTIDAQAKMPVSPVAYFSLAHIMHGIKSYSVNQINGLLQRKSNVWLDENYERIIRDEKEYREKLQYILNNPVKTGLVEKHEDYRWLFFERNH